MCSNTGTPAVRLSVIKKRKAEVLKAASKRKVCKQKQTEDNSQNSAG
jgi:hypothetical protein